MSEAVVYCATIIRFGSVIAAFDQFATEMMNGLTLRHMDLERHCEFSTNQVGMRFYQL